MNKNKNSKKSQRLYQTKFSYLHRKYEDIIFLMFYFWQNLNAKTSLKVPIVGTKS